MKDVAVATLLLVGGAAELACCVGVMVMPSAYDRLHFTAPATTIGPLAIAGAVIVEESLSSAGVKAILIAGLLGIVNPVLTHATGRAGGIRRHGDFRSLEKRGAGSAGSRNREEA